MEIVVLAESDVPVELREQVLRARRQAWPAERVTERWPTHDPALRPLSMLLVERGRVVSALDILSKEIVHTGHRYAASGLSTVVTDQELRGKGYGRKLVRAARETVVSSGADLGIFTCDAPLQGFYEGAGWQMLPGTVLLGGTPEAPFPSDQLEKVTMAGFFSDPACRHAQDFVGARIELYPGAIDKLW